MEFLLHTAGTKGMAKDKKKSVLKEKLKGGSP